MSKTTRLFKLMDVLRARRTAVTAAQLARYLSVSKRTVYRDLQALIDLGARIDGSAGVGYALRAGFFLPSLMFEEEEVEALVLGARWASAQGDPALSHAAESLLAKISAACPNDLRDKISETGLWAPRLKKPDESAPSLMVIREAIRRERKLKIQYRNAAEVLTARVVWPIALGFFETTRVLAAWCELRGDFRHFRIDRIAGLEKTAAPYPRPRRELTKLWRSQLKSSKSD